MRHQAVILTAALIASAGSLILATHSAAQDQPLFAPGSLVGSCTIKKTEYSTIGDGFNETASTAFVDLQGAGSISFTQKKIGCVTGIFDANGGAETTGDHLVLQVLLDGGLCLPFTTNTAYYFANSGDDFSSHSVGFFCDESIAPGTHQIKVRFASRNGGKVAIYQRSLTVAHN